MRSRHLLLVAALGVVLLAACSSGDEGGDAAGAAGNTPTGDRTLVDPIVAEEGLGSCAERFGEDTLAGRQWAFEGTVSAIREPEAMDAPYEVDFAVARWFHGGDATTITVRTYDVSGTSFAGDLALAEGYHLLASGDDEFLWGCGFSMMYSQEGAELFERAFAAQPE